MIGISKTIVPKPIARNVVKMLVKNCHREVKFIFFLCLFSRNLVVRVLMECLLIERVGCLRQAFRMRLLLIILGSCAVAGLLRGLCVYVFVPFRPLRN